MESRIIQCPVCGEDMISNSTFCPNCSFEIHILPDAAPLRMREFEDMRIENARQGYALTKQKLLAKDKEISRLTAEVQSRVENDSDNSKDVISQLQSLIKKNQEDLAVANQQIRQLRNENEMLSGESSNSTDKVSSAKRPFAYLLVFDNHEAVNVIGIFEGQNSFGSAPSVGTHRQLLLDPDLISDRHFMITASASANANGRRRVEYRIIPLNGRIYRAEGDGNIISGEESFEINDTLYVGGYSFHLLDNIDNREKK